MKQWGFFGLFQQAAGYVADGYPDSRKDAGFLLKDAARMTMWLAKDGPNQGGETRCSPLGKEHMEEAGSGDGSAFPYFGSHKANVI
jgi:hypothetical protein